MPDDIIDIEILPDGRIRSENGKISNANHSNAGQFYRLLEEITGGKVERSKRKDRHVKIHDKLEHGH